MKSPKHLILVLLFLLAGALTLAAFRGLPAPDGKSLRFQVNTDYDSYPTSPFEVTNSNSRYTLIESILDRGTFFFTDEQAKLSAPDIVYHNGKYFSIFTPGISFLALPFYLIGKSIGLPQFVTFLFNILALLLNIVLIIRLSQKLGANKYVGFLAGLVYVFATNSLAYSLSLSQHQFSATLVLLALLNAAQPKRGLLNNFFLGIIFSLGVLVDIPNLFAILPIFIWVAFRHFEIHAGKLKINLHLLLLALSVIPLFAVFAWYNYSLTGSLTKLGQVIGRSDFPHKESPPQVETPNVFNYHKRTLPLGTRLQLNGFYQLLFSNERGWFYYSPVVALGLLGLFLALKNPSTKSLALLCFSTILVTVVVYSMHGDPWGGWAFGARYMIPSSAVVASGLALAFSQFKKHLLFIAFFIILTVYSVIVSVAGALTTTLIPPKVEAVYFENPLPYTFKLNLDYIFEKQLTGSLAYHLWLKNIFDVKTFYFVFTGLALALIGISYLLALKTSNDK